MKRSILMLTAACVILAAAPVRAQSYYQKEANLFAEIFGNGGELSLNFEKFVGRTMGVRVGVGLTGVAFRKGYVVPFGVSFFLGESRNKIELGAGGAWIDSDDNGTDETIFDVKEDQVVANAVIGYRFIGDYGFTYRVGFTPALTKDGFKPMGGALFGYSF